MRSKTLTVLAGILVLGVLVVAAGPVLAHHTDDKPRVKDPWVREVLPGQDLTGAFLVLENAGHEPDFLVAASCDCAKTVEIHRMVQADGRMKMEKMNRLEIPAGGKVELKPGGFHLMLFGVRKDLKAGATVTLELRFEHGGVVKVEAPVKAAEGAKRGHAG